VPLVDVLAPEPLRSISGVLAAASIALIRTAAADLRRGLLAGDDGAWEPFLPDLGADG
jgi:hypothetical protein